MVLPPKNKRRTLDRFTNQTFSFVYNLNREDLVSDLQVLSYQMAVDFDLYNVHAIRQMTHL